MIQGGQDPFGMPPPGKRRKVVEVKGTHSLRSGLGAVRDAAAAWLAQIVPPPA